MAISELKYWCQRMSAHSDLARAFVVTGTKSSLDVGSDSSSLSFPILPPLRWISKLIDEADLSTNTVKTGVVVLLVTSTLCAFVSLVAISLWPIILAIGFAAVQIWWISKCSFRRAEAFERDFPALLLSLSSAAKSGIDPLVAIAEARNLFDMKSEVRKELDRLASTLESGASEQEALSAFGRTIAHPDITLFRVAFSLARREGASLAPALQRLARVVRTRQSFRRKTRAAIAMQRLSSFGIVGCALVVATIQVATNFDSISQALRNPLGVRLYAVGVSFLMIGLLWMLRITRPQV